MAEPRRIGLISVDGPPQQKKVRKTKVTRRFELSLVDTTNEECPEFSYVELLKNDSEKSGLENGTDPHGDDPLGGDDDHDKLMAIARAFEDKYGPKPGKKKKFYSELMDLGDGYDVDDPFVDNSEAFDEVLPYHLNTAYGGFYINTGTLQFRENSDMEGEEEDEIILKKRKKFKKQKINSDSESESGRWKKKKRGRKKKKLLDGSDIGEKKRKKLMEGGIEGEKKKKKRKLGPDGEIIVKKRGRPKLNPLSDLNVPAAEDSQDKTPAGTPADTNNEDSSSSHSSASNTGDAATSTAASSAANTPSGAFNKPLEELTTPNLPSNLPPSLLEATEKLKQAADRSVEGKCKFFTPSVNKMLLDVELQARQLKPRIRKVIYTHLAGHLPCGKETLMKRAKKLRLNPTNDKIKSTMVKLSEAVSSVMPTMHQKHQEECKVAMEARDSKMNGEKEGGEAMDVSLVDSDDESRKEGGGGEKEGEKDGKEKRFMLPRKKFEWNMDISCLLSELVKIKMEEYEQAKNPSETSEEFLRKFLDTEVKPLWPKGWIQTRMLFKESRGVHAKWTNPAVVKPRKAPSASKPSTPSNLSGAAGVSSTSLDVTPTSALSAPKVTPNATAGGPKAVSAKATTSSPSNLLDYAEGSFASKARGHVTPGGNKQPSTGLSFTTTNTLGSTPAMQALQNIGHMVDKAAKTPQITVSGPATPTSPVAKKTSTPQSSSFMSSFLEFAMKKVSPEIPVTDDDSPAKGVTADSTQSQDIADTLRSISALSEASRGMAGSVEAGLSSSLSGQSLVQSTASSVGPQDSILTSTFQTPKGAPRSQQPGPTRSILGQMPTPQLKVAPDASQTWLPSNLARPSTSPSSQASQRASFSNSADAARSISSTVNRTVSSTKPAHSASASPHYPRSAGSVSSPSHSRLCPTTGQILSSPKTSPKAGSQQRTSSPGAASTVRSSPSPQRPSPALQGSTSNQASPTQAQRLTSSTLGTSQWTSTASVPQRPPATQTSSTRKHSSPLSAAPRPTSMVSPGSSQPAQRLPSQATSTQRPTTQTVHTTATQRTTASQLAVSQPAQVSTSLRMADSHSASNSGSSQQHKSLFPKPSPSRPPATNTAATAVSRGLSANQAARAASQVSSTNMLKNTSTVRTSDVTGYGYTSPGTVSSSSGGRKLPTMEASFGARASPASSGQTSSCMQASISPTRKPTASPTSSGAYAGYQPTHNRSPVSSPSQAALWRSADHVSSSSAYGLGSAANGLYLQQTGACQQPAYSAAHQAMLQQAADARIHSSSMFGQQATSPTHNLAQPHLLGHSPHHGSPHSSQSMASAAVAGLGLHAGLTQTALTYGLPYADSQSSQPY